MRITYLVGGYLFLLIGIVGIVLPVLPTTPFLIISAGCFSRSNEKIERWLKTHPLLGPPICNWQEFGCIPFRAKVLATAMISFTVFGMLLWGHVPNQAQALLLGAIFLGLVYVWTRPSSVPRTSSAAIEEI